MTWAAWAASGRGGKAAFGRPPGGIQISFYDMGSNSGEPFAGSRDDRDELRQRVRQAVPAADIPAERTDTKLTHPDIPTDCSVVGTKVLKAKMLREWPDSDIRRAQARCRDLRLEAGRL